MAEISAEFAPEHLVGVEDSQVEETDTATDDGELGDVDIYADTVEDVLPGRIVRRKVHPDVPMSVDDALYQMERWPRFLPVSRQRNRSASSGLSPQSLRLWPNYTGRIIIIANNQ